MILCGTCKLSRVLFENVYMNILINKDILSRKAELLLVQVAILDIEKDAIIKVRLAIAFGAKTNIQIYNVPQCQKCNFV